MTPTRAELEALARRQREARAAGQTVPLLPQEWDLRDAYLRSAYLLGADLRGAQLSMAFLVGAELRDANLRDATLPGADLSGAFLAGARMAGADLRGAFLPRADLHNADLRGADLRGAMLRGADLADADIRGAIIAEGSVTASAAGKRGWYRWHALRLDDGTVILQYGCDRATLAQWRTRGPEYGFQYGQPPEHWATGPAVAIAAAERLAAG